VNKELKSRVIPMSMPDISEEDVQVVSEVVRSGRLAWGPGTGDQRT
jgi:hypothetical protein